MAATLSTNRDINFILQFIYDEFGVSVSEEDAARFAAEVDSGDRELNDLRSDLFEFRVGLDKVSKYVTDTFDAEGIDIAKGDETAEQRVDRIVGELTTGKRQFANFANDVATSEGGTGGDQGVVGGVGKVKVDESPGTKGVGGVTDDTLSILTSKDMKWFFDDKTGQWMVSYKLPNSDRSVVFAATGSQLDAIFGEGIRPNSFETISFADLTQREGVTFAGDISEVEGTGTFEGEVDRVIALALDEGTLPKWAQGNGAVYDLLFIAQSENKSSEWLIDELAKLPSFKTRFPGIEALTGLGLTNTEAVTGFLELELGIKELTMRDGGDPDSITPDMVGGLIAKGHSLTDVTKTFEVFDRMTANQGALDAFNEVLVARGQQPLSGDDQFEFMNGNAPAELYDIWEEASLHQAAIDAGLDIGVDAAISLAARTEGLTSFATATAGLTQAAANMLRFRGELDFGRFGIDEQDIIDMSLGLAPSSGVSQADLSMSMERAFSSAKATRERARVNPFKRFSDQGVPQAASLSGLRQESG